MNTKNNHEIMKTVVETFLIEETIDLIHDNEQLDKWNSHVQDLGLEGQTKIVKKDKSPIPFMHLKKSQKNICEEICPMKVDVKKYSITPIPVEILDLIALSFKEEHFHKIEVWYDDKAPDPFVVGLIGEYYSYNEENKSKYFKTEMEAIEYSKDGTANFSNWSAEQYLIGKWADVKRSWEELKDIAIKRFVAKEGNEFRKQIKQAERGLEDLETSAFDKFN